MAKEMLNRDFALTREIIYDQHKTHIFEYFYLIMKISSQVCHLCHFIVILSNPYKNLRIYFILYSENQCISKYDKIGIFIDMKFH